MRAEIVPAGRRDQSLQRPGALAVPAIVAAYVEQLQGALSTPSVEQHLAAIRTSDELALEEIDRIAIQATVRPLTRPETRPLGRDPAHELGAGRRSREPALNRTPSR